MRCRGEKRGTATLSSALRVMLLILTKLIPLLLKCTQWLPSAYKIKFQLLYLQSRPSRSGPCLPLLPQLLSLLSGTGDVSHE